MDDERWADPRTARRDPKQQEAVEALEALFEENQSRVYFSRQLDVMHETKWFHWVTHRAVEDLVTRGVVKTEMRSLVAGGSIRLLWHRNYRYYKRDASRVVALVEAYSAPNVGRALGLQGEFMVVEGFARKQFVLHGRNVSSFRGRSWTKTAHNLDFICERDGIAYGVEVKNILPYMEYEELQVKIELCDELELKPVFAVRMLPKSWINEIWEAGGFALILKYQLYPWSHRALAEQVAEEFNLPVDSPSSLEDGTMDRFVKWHVRQLPVNHQENSPAPI